MYVNLGLKTVPCIHALTFLGLYSSLIYKLMLARVMYIIVHSKDKYYRSVFEMYALPAAKSKRHLY